MSIMLDNVIFLSAEKRIMSNQKCIGRIIHILHLFHAVSHSILTGGDELMNFQSSLEHFFFKRSPCDSHSGVERLSTRGGT